MNAPSPAEAPAPREVRADVTRLLTALVKIALVADGGATAPWRAEAAAAQRRLPGAADALAALHLDGLWSVSVKAAERDPAVRRGETVNPTLPTMVPLRPDQLGADPFDLDGAVRQIRDAASFG